ncbi:glycosyl hydrolase [Glacieibacterium megasporae]|uniref:glycosyl hydrolase n=1 Tax=Glacieibacterium megasporae TaxID=2835787 RepID=UPI001C1E58C1|nr:glycosyl hydrolase [Polymorphobacter megasporae]UAJ11096.1 glycoside hydrolase [Polymorphobacter megasporae]
MTILAIADPTPTLAADLLSDGFLHPPKNARPLAWWHWMNGNVSAEGAKLDLEWLSEAGVGGVQMFEAGLGTPLVVAQPAPFMSSEWTAALRTSATTAKMLGLDLTIAASPGWSATGGPWVTPVDGMKKLVWSETHIDGGRRFHAQLANPPMIAGPYQDVPLTVVEPGMAAGPALYGDAAVIAFRSGTAPRPTAVQVTASRGSVDAALLSDGAWGQAMSLPYTPTDPTAWLLYDFGKPVTIRSAAVGMPGPRGFGTPLPSLAFVEASDDGHVFRRLAALPPSGSPVRSVGFAAETARWFRIRFEPDASAPVVDAPPAAGALMPRFGPPPPLAYAVSEVMLDPAPRLSAAEEKAGFATLLNYDAVLEPAASGVDPRTIIDLTQRMQTDGTLDWTPPTGQWTVLRLGWSLTGHRNGPAPDEATGLEVDKLDAGRVAAYSDHYLGLYENALGGPLRPAGVTGLLSDSIEAGPQTWTETLPAQFRQRRGYDPTPWLAALTGVVVGNTAESERFLWDWRRTIAELYADAHYATLRTAALHRGLTYYAEALEDHRPQLGDDMAMRARADVPMAAMWALAPGGEPKATFVADIAGAASVANLYGKPVVAAESFTAFGSPWAFAPSDLKATADLEMALGVNLIVIHTSAHQPLVDAAPGIALAPFLGQYFTRNETWAPMARAWTDYLARGSFLLQQGRHAADILYFYGEESPITGLYGDAMPRDLPDGYGVDFLNTEALATRLHVDQGALVTPNGLRYRLLQLGGSSSRMTLATLRRIHELLTAGASVVGTRPLGSPSLSDDDAAVARETTEIWGPPGTTGQRSVGRGFLFGDGDVKTALGALDLDRDWRWSGNSDARLAVIHRKLDDGELYYVVNRRARREAGELSLRVAGRVPELWRADDAQKEAVSYRVAGARTLIPLDLAPGDAVFIVLRRLTTIKSVTIPVASTRTIAALGKNWQLTLAAGRGAPAGRHPTNLGSWTASTDSGVRYFSGIGTYTNAVTVTKATLSKARRIMLDLGEVRDIAEVSVNGRRAGTAWRPPYQTEITPFLHAGTNRIAIRVANLWVNRLIGDAQPGARQITHTTGSTYSASAPLRPSGLLGPVRLIALDQK